MYQSNRVTQSLFSSFTSDYLLLVASTWSIYGYRLFVTLSVPCHPVIVAVLVFHLFSFLSLITVFFLTMATSTIETSNKIDKMIRVAVYIILFFSTRLDHQSFSPFFNKLWHWTCSSTRHLDVSRLTKAIYSNRAHPINKHLLPIHQNTKSKLCSTSNMA
jgi:hypothetical protein